MVRKDVYITESQDNDIKKLAQQNDTKPSEMHRRLLAYAILKAKEGEKI